MINTNPRHSYCKFKKVIKSCFQLKLNSIITVHYIIALWNIAPENKLKINEDSNSHFEFLKKISEYLNFLSRFKILLFELPDHRPLFANSTENKHVKGRVKLSGSKLEH